MHALCPAFIYASSSNALAEHTECKPKFWKPQPRAAAHTSLRLNSNSVPCQHLQGLSLGQDPSGQVLYKQKIVDSENMSLKHITDWPLHHTLN